MWPADEDPLPFQSKKAMPTRHTPVRTDEKDTNDPFNNALTMLVTRRALTAVRAWTHDRSSFARRLARDEPLPPIPWEAEIKSVAVGTPKVADTDRTQHYVGQVMASLGLTALLVTGWTGRHRGSLVPASRHQPDLDRKKQRLLLNRLVQDVNRSEM